MEDNNMIQPVEEMRKLVFDSTIDLGIDLSEICIDMLQEDEIIKEVPVLGTVYKIGKIGYSVTQLIFIKKALVFAQAMQLNDVNGEILSKHRELVSKNPSQYFKELEIIIEYLNKQVGYEKSVLNARAYYLYLSSEIDYEDLMLLWEVIDQFYINDKETLLRLYRENVADEQDYSDYNKVACKRLANCCLIDFFNGMPAVDYETGMSIYAKITKVGEFFCEKILKI